MTQEEWLKDFENKNGRPPTQNEFSAAWSSGAFSAPTPNAPEDSGKKRSKTGLIIGIVAGLLAVILLSVGGYTYYLYSSGDINGTWRSSELEKKMEKTVSDSLSTYSEDYDLSLSKYFKDANVKMTSKNDKVLMTVSYTVDAEGISKAVYKFLDDQFEEQLKAYLESSGGDSLTDQEKQAIKDAYFTNLPSQESLQKSLETSIKESAEEEGLTYDTKTGKIHGELFRGKVNRFSKTVSITEYNKNAYVEDINKGDVILFEKEKDKLILDAEKGDDITFEKAGSVNADV